MKKKASPKGKGVSAADVKKIALSFPEAHEKLSYGRPAFFIAKKFFTRVRSEDASLVMGVEGGMEQRDMMLELDPDTYFITDHYKDYPMLLVRLSHISKDELHAMLDRRFRAIAPKKLISKDAVASKPAPAKRKPVRKRKLLTKR